MGEEDLYKILKVSRDADAKTIKSAYRKIARENHPDRNPDDEAAEDRFKKASFAFEVLSDIEKRKAYDAYGIDGLRDGFQSGQQHQWGSTGAFNGGANFEDIFGQIFGQRGGYSQGGFGGGQDPFGGFQQRPQRARDTEAQLTLEFMSAIEGGEMTIRIGGKDLRVRIPSGADSGDKIRIKGKGNPAPNIPGSKPGDLILELKVESHALLKRKGLKLYLDVPITIGEAIRGAKIDVPTPSGIFTVTIPSGMHSGGKLRLKGKGVKRGKKTGDFFVIVQIKSPDTITDEIKTLVDTIDEGYSEPLRSTLTL